MMDGGSTDGGSDSGAGTDTPAEDAGVDVAMSADVPPVDGGAIDAPPRVDGGALAETRYVHVSAGGLATCATSEAGDGLC
ncbi:hypothetical protein ACI3PL_24105, partial [Lacticaseibacillus paracasei]